MGDDTDPPQNTPKKSQLRLKERLQEMSFARMLFVLALVAGMAGTLFLWFQRQPASPFDDRNFTPEVVIIQLNDVYRIDAVRNGTIGGLGRVATLINQTKQQSPNVMIVHAGDFISPSLESNFFQGQQMIDALNYLNGLAPLYVVPGNHEFDEKDPSGAVVANAIRKSNFQWVASNLVLKTNDSEANARVLPYHVESVGKLRVGIFALTIQGAQSGRDRVYSEITARDQYQISDETLADLKADFHPAVLKALEGLKTQTLPKAGFITAVQQKIDKDNKEFWDKIRNDDTFWSALGDEGSWNSEDNKKKLLDSLKTKAEFWSSIADAASQRYLEPAETVIKELENQGANVIIGLTHLDMADDKQIARLRRRHPSFVWIAGGHEHYAQRESLSRDSALITKGDSNARSVWKISIGLKDGKPQISEQKIEVTEANLPVDQNYQQLITANYHARLKEKLPYLDDVITSVQSIVKTNNGKERSCFEASEEVVRNRKSDWGSYLAGQMRNAYTEPKAQIGVLNGGGIRIDDELCNQIKYEEFERSIGFPTRVVYVELKGSAIKSMLEHSVGGKRGDGSFLQVAGVRFEFSRKRVPGERVLNVQVQKDNGWAKLNPDGSYWVAVSDYLFGCGDDYDFRTAAIRYVPAGPDLRTLVLNSLKRASAAGADPGTLSEGPFEIPLYAQHTEPKKPKPEEIGAANKCP